LIYKESLAVKVIWLLLLGRGDIQRLLDLVMSLIILCLLAALMVAFYQPLKGRAVVSHNAIYGLEKFRREITLQWAIEGTWPSDEDDLMRTGLDAFDDAGEGLVESAVYENGAIHIRSGRENDMQVLTCRPAVFVENKTGPVTWICGHRLSLDARWIVQGEDKTTVDPFIIPESFQ
jgi:hypothetical protein